MERKYIWLSLLGIAISFIGGFLIANAINRNEIAVLTAENDRLRKNVSDKIKTETVPDLSAEVIREKIAEAEKNKNNFTFQKSLGLALYRYSAMKQDSNLLEDVRKLLMRANKINPDDYDVLVSLGNVNFDIGRGEKSESDLQKAREFYKKALEKNPKDINVRTDLGWTFLLAPTAEYEPAIKEFTESLKLDPKHEKSLQLMTEALVKKEEFGEAKEYLTKLKKINPQNQMIAELEKKIGSENK